MPAGETLRKSGARLARLMRVGTIRLVFAWVVVGLVYLGTRADPVRAMAVARFVFGAALIALTVALILVAASRFHGSSRAEAAFTSVVFVLTLGVYAVRLVDLRSTSVTACDSYAYLQGATMMAARGPLHSELVDPLVPRIVAAFPERPPDRELAFFLSPHGHYVRDFQNGIGSNVFPPGLMWLLLPLVAVGGAGLALLFLPVLTPAVGLAIFLLGRRHVHAWIAACAAVFAVGNRVVFENTVMLMSDVPSMALTAASAYLLYLNLGKPRPLLPVAAGACLGFALTIRYSNAAAIVPVLVLFAVEWARRRDLRGLARDVALFGAAATLLGVVPLALYTWAQFGTLFHTTYDPYITDWMRVVHLLPNLAFYGRGLLQTFGWPVLAVTVVGLAACIVERKRRLVAVAGVLTGLAFFVPYVFERMHEHRYLMPVYPWLGIFYGFGSWTLGKLFRKVEGVRWLAMAALVVAPLLPAWNHSPRGTVSRDQECRDLAGRVEPDAVVFCDDFSGPVRTYAGLTGYRFVWTEPAVLDQTCRTLARLGRPVYFLLDCDSAKERFQLLQEKGVLAPGRFTSIGEIGGRPLWRYVGAP